jgi:hypothetical protein
MHDNVLVGRSIWALIIPKYHEYFIVFTDKSTGAQQDELLTLFRKTLKSKNIPNPECEKI